MVFCLPPGDDDTISERPCSGVGPTASTWRGQELVGGRAEGHCVGPVEMGREVLVRRGLGHHETRKRVGELLVATFISAQAEERQSCRDQNAKRGTSHFGSWGCGVTVQATPLSLQQKKGADLSCCGN